MTEVELLCGILGNKRLAFTVKIAVSAKVEELRQVIASSQLVDTPSKQVRLYRVIDADLGRFVSSGAPVELQSSETVDSFREIVTLPSKNVHIIVHFRSEEKAPLAESEQEDIG
ncbi:unnamed protein product [Phytophthora lilii]|uniref:Unnamed protein product n=1 Tax=Phytophthora lilii TaxID=2077276 RepID=A0A9W6UC42_9STRA|nr:unnamed protein product [Phytophthora lilii]